VVAQLQARLQVAGEMEACCGTAASLVAGVRGAAVNLIDTAGC